MSETGGPFRAPVDGAPERTPDEEAGVEGGGRVGPHGAVARPMAEADVEGVAHLERDTFSAPWKPDTFRRLLPRDGTELWVVETPAHGVVGYAVLWFVQEQGELANIAIRPEHRGRGLGSFLLDRIVERAVEKGVRSLYLEVRVSNTRAARLYERRGFREIGRRRNYYERPREDARVLARRLP